MSRPFLQLTRLVAVAAAVAVVVVLIKGRDSSDTEDDKPKAKSGLVADVPAAASDVIALLDGLKPGDKLESVTVLAIDAPSDRVIRVHAGGDDVAFTIGVHLAGSVPGKQPPVVTERYEIGYGNVRGSGAVPTGAMGNAAEALAVRIRRRESEVPVPAGM